MSFLVRRISHIFLFLCIVFAIMFISLGITTNPYIDIFKDKPTPEYKVTNQELYLPRIISAGKPEHVTIWCNMTTTDFVVGNPSYLWVQVSIESKLYDIYHVHIKPRNSILYVSPVPPWEYPDVQKITSMYPFFIDLEKVNDDPDYEIWTGGQWIELQSSGTLELDLIITLVPVDMLINDSEVLTKFNELFPNSDYTQSLRFEAIPIDSLYLELQKENENLNLSLSYIVLFFACVEVAIAIYTKPINNKDSNENSKNENKEEKKEINNENESQYII